MGDPDLGLLAHAHRRWVAERPAFAPDGGIERREYLSLTVSVDHDVVDGAPAARFIQRLNELIECGYGPVVFAVSR